MIVIRKLLIVLFSLIIIGILWLRSRYWEFSEEMYVNDDLEQKTLLIRGKLDIDFLKREFESAYEF